MKLSQLVMLIVALALFVSACGQDDETPVPEANAATPTTAAQASTQQDATESPLSTATVSPIATPAAQGNGASDNAAVASASTEDYQQPRAIAQPNKGQATLAGRVLAQFGDNTALEPVVLSAVYLAPVLREANGTPSVASLDSQLDPSSSTDPNGYFVFDNVPPGQYGFVIYYGVTHYLIRDEAGQQMVITLEPDQLLDLGVIHTTLPDSW